MYRIFLFFLLILANYNCLSQYPSDSLKNLLRENVGYEKTSIRDSVCTILIKNIFSSSKYSDFSFQKYWSDSLTSFAKSSKWPQTIGYAYLTKGIYNHRSGNTKLSIVYYEKASTVFHKINKKAYANVITNLATIISLNLLNYNIEDPTTLKRYLKYIEENLNISIKEGNNVYISTNLITKALFYMVQNRHDLALPIFKLANTYTNKITTDLAYNYHVSLAGQGICYLNLNQEKKGFELLKKAKFTPNSKVSSDEEKYLYTLICIFESKYLLKKGEYKKVKNYALNTLKTGKHLNFPIFINQLNNILFIAYKNLNEPQNALEYLEKINSYKEKEENKNFTAQYTEWQTKYETEKQNSTIKTLEVNQLKNQNEKNNLARNVLIFSLLAGVGLFFYIYSNNLKLQTKNKELVYKNKEIEEALFKGQTIERKRIGVELHDNLSAKIGAIRWRLESLNPTFNQQADSDFYNNTINALNETYSDVRLIAHNLLPEILEEKGLHVAVESLVAELNSLNKTKFQYLFLGENKRYPNKIEYELYSILLELSNNILKHSQAENALISIRNFENELKLIVSDDGIGVENQTLNYGMGFKNIKSRLAQLNGNMQLETENGLKIEITV